MCETGFGKEREVTVADVDITIQIYCDTCGRDLEADWNWRKKELNVKPCVTCIEKAVKDVTETMEE